MTEPAFHKTSYALQRALDDAITANAVIEGRHVAYHPDWSDERVAAAVDPALWGKIPPQRHATIVMQFRNRHFGTIRNLRGPKPAPSSSAEVEAVRADLALLRAEMAILMEALGKRLGRVEAEQSLWTRMGGDGVGVEVASRAAGFNGSLGL